MYNRKNEARTMTALVTLMVALFALLSATAMTAIHVEVTDDRPSDEYATAAGVPTLSLLGMSVNRRQVVAELTRDGLLEIAKELQISGRSKMSKDELRAAIEEASKPTSANHTGTGKVERFSDDDAITLPTQRAAELKGKVLRLNHPDDGGMVIIDENDKQHRVGYRNWTALGQAMERGLNGFYYSDWTPGGGKGADKPAQLALLTKANEIPMEERATCKFRVIDTMSDGTTMADPQLYAVLSTDYTEVLAEDVYDEIRQYLSPDLYHYKMTGNDGIHAGTIQITARHTDRLGIFNYHATINCGNMNGMSSVSVSGGARVLACANQISFDVMKLARELNIKIDIGTGSRGARRHAGDIDGITDWVCEVIDGASAMDGMVHASLANDLDDSDFTALLDYYTHKRGMAKSLRTQLETGWKDDTITQVPQTLYGFVMLTTYVGSHDDGIKSGVSNRLRTIGGELLAIAPNFVDLFPAIEAGAIEYREKLVKIAEEKAAKEAAALEAAKEAANAPTETPITE